MSQMVRQREEEEARKKLELLQLQNRYKSPSYANYSSEHRANFVNEHYQRYLQQVQQASQYEEESQEEYKQGAKKQSQSQSEYDDVDDQIDSDSQQSSNSQNAQSSIEDLVLASCDYNEFSSLMSKQYGQQQFTEGFAVMNRHKDLILSEEGEEKLVNLLKRLFTTEDLTRGFINLCISYMIV